MDSDSDDDIYGAEEVNGRREVKMEDVEDGEEEGEEVEDDSDDEVNFITDAKEEPKEPKQESPSQSKRQPNLKQPATPDVQRKSRSPQPRARGGSGQSQDIKHESQPPDDKPGLGYPARHTSKLDPNGNPIRPSTGKPILSTDFDTDFPTESTKPWRKPGSDITDFFNYGFDEFTWASYCLKQQQMPKEIQEINQQAEQMKAFVEGIPGGGMPGMPGVPTGPAAAAPAGGGMQMPGMPSEAEMQQMFQGMMAQGMDPSSMDSNQFMQMMMGGGMGQGQPPTGPQDGGFGSSGAGFGQGGGFDTGSGGGGGPRGGGRGRGRGRRGNW